MNVAIDYERQQSERDAAQRLARLRTAKADNYSKDNQQNSGRNSSNSKVISMADYRARHSSGEMENEEGLDDKKRGMLQKKIDEYKQKYKDSKKLGGEAVTLVKSATPWGILSLLGEINILTDWTYFAALMAAILKDTLDIAIIGQLPGIGTAISICASLFIMFMLILGNIMHAEHDRTIFQSYILRQWLVLAVVTIIEIITGAATVPAESIGVLLIWAFALAARKGRHSVEKKSQKE